MIAEILSETGKASILLLFCRGLVALIVHNWSESNKTTTTT
jgi:hypothetical protein